MKWSELEKRARKQGWIFLRHGASHDIYYHPRHDETLLIGRHKSQEVPGAVQRRLKRNFGL